MRIRAAGGLLVGPLLYPVALTLEQTGARLRGRQVLRALFWTRGDAGLHEAVVVVARDALFGIALLVAILAIFGARFARVLLPLVALAIALFSLPWVIYDIRAFTRTPPRWVFENQLWYPEGRYTSLLWIAVLLLAALLAATDRRPRRDPADRDEFVEQPRAAFAGGSPPIPPTMPAPTGPPRTDPPPTTPPESGAAPRPTGDEPDATRPLPEI